LGACPTFHVSPFTLQRPGLAIAKTSRLCVYPHFRPHAKRQLFNDKSNHVKPRQTNRVVTIHHSRFTFQPSGQGPLFNSISLCLCVCGSVQLKSAKTPMNSQKSSPIVPNRGGRINAPSLAAPHSASRFTLHVSPPILIASLVILSTVVRRHSALPLDVEC